MTELSELERVRKDKMERLRQAGMEPYPIRSSRTHTTQAAIQAFEASGEEGAVEATVVGRLRSIRRMG
jgi:lysyl-tRNA synthetase class 2